ncbi:MULTISPECIES: hormogonium polysaccharide secretion pseudopilin HpsC [unclassified Microcoleus]|uniref:hormogonium polysaccharide secretion pseudopilin HpsC n=1 Tax=unclassified Microcoleus TaxID=2642155 RepID=UPI002FD7268C
MKTLLRLLLKSQHQRNRSGQTQTENGMTLVELLVGAIMAFLIITPMLGFVVDMLNTDRREQVKSNTEQDLQAAADFISQDLSQAIYIYDNNPATTSTPTTTPTGIPAIKDQLPTPANGTPILVFWKQQPRKNSVPFNPEVAKTVKPKDCDTNPGKCNDTYVLSLVAYYQIRDSDATWCQPSGGTCPTRIARYEITDGIRDPNATDTTDPNYPYYKDSDTKDTQQRDPAFSKDFDFSKPTVNVTDPTGLKNSKSGATKPQVLVNYIDHTKNSDTALLGTECQTALGNPINLKTTQPLTETTLRVTDAEGINSFYACVDTSKNLARVTIRGNSLRRLQANGADFTTTSSAYFPTATVQVQGLGARGK